MQALSGVDLAIEEGDFFALLGANGAGKTTFIGIMTSLVSKTNGTLKIFGHDIDTDFSEAKKQLGVVPQEFNFSIFERVIDIVVDQAGYYGIAKNVAEERAHHLLEELDLGDKKYVPSRTLSGGMKRRLMIARSLVHSPRMLILDEPTAGVDVELRRGMWHYLTRLNQKEGVTILLTTHYLEEVEQLCRNAAFIRGGKIVISDSVKNLLRYQQSIRYVIETDKLPEEIEGGKYEIKRLDDTTVEAILRRDETINSLVEFFSERGLVVKSIDTKENALEELFLRTNNTTA